MKRFPALLDTTAKMITTVCCVVLVIPFITIGQHVAATHDYRLLIVPALVIAGLVYAVLWKPTAYTVDGEALEIRRPLGPRRILRSDIGSVAVLDRSGMGFGLRTFGSGGAFGYLGWFWYRNAGHLKMYVTDQSRMVLITLKNGRKIVVSPDDTEGFVRALA